MLIATIADFVKHIPTAEGTEFSAISPYLATAEEEVKTELTGADLFTYISGLTGTAPMKDVLCSLIAVTAYKNAIPFVDLIQTANGFGVVNNNNVSPASKERVERLIAWCENLMYSTTDVLTSLVYSTPAALTEWEKFAQFNTLTSCLFITGIDFSNYAKIEGSRRKAFLQAKNEMVAWQSSILEPVISVVFMAELMTAIRANTATTKQAAIIHLCKMVLGILLAKDTENAEKLLNNISNVLDKDLTSYATYAASEEYALRIAKPYENKQTDSTFFFGR